MISFALRKSETFTVFGINYAVSNELKLTQAAETFCHKILFCYFEHDQLSSCPLLRYLLGNKANIWAILHGIEILVKIVH